MRHEWENICGANSEIQTQFLQSLSSYSVDNKLPVYGDGKKDNRQHQSDTLGKLWFIVFCRLKKKEKSLHSLSTADKISKISFLKELYLEYRASEFFFFCWIFFTILQLNQGRTGIFYKLCKNLINTKSQTDCRGHQKRKRKKRRNNMMWISCYSLYYCTQYTNWSFVLFSSLLLSTWIKRWR